MKATNDIIKYIKRDLKEEELAKKQGTWYDIICMADVEPEEVKWLWYPFIPLGKTIILQGDPGLGKTFLAVEIAAIVSNGGTFPFSGDGEKREPSNVLFQTAEDGLSDTIIIRLDKAQANNKRVFVMEEGDKILTLDDGRLRDAISKLNPKLVVIDPMQAFIGSDKDMHRANEMRPIFRKLDKIASEFGCAIVLIRHLTKGKSGKAIYDGLGSIDISAAVRSILQVCEVPETENRRAIVHIKSNLAVNGQVIFYDLDPERGFTWAGAGSLTENDLLSHSKAVKQKTTVLVECMQFLKGVLANDRVAANEVKRIAKENGFTEITVERAKEELGVKPKKMRNADGKMQSFWSLSSKSIEMYDDVDDVDDLT